jgi:hypothetical protein
VRFVAAAVAETNLHPCRALLDLIRRLDLMCLFDSGLLLKESLEL